MTAKFITSLLYGYVKQGIKPWVPFKPFIMCYWDGMFQYYTICIGIMNCWICEHQANIPFLH